MILLMILKPSGVGIADAEQIHNSTAIIAIKNMFTLMDFQRVPIKIKPRFFLTEVHLLASFQL